jgi:RNA polymerase sigma-70 factor (ECF subfamily)
VGEGHTTAVVQRYLDALNGDGDAEPIIRALLERSAQRLQMLSANLLYRSYPRLARPPLNLQQDELLSAVVERLLRALRTVHPGNVRQFFGLANQHMRWELNDLARRLDEQPRVFELVDAAAESKASTVAGPGPVMRRMLEAIENLPEDEREVFSLVRVQGMSHGEAADVLDVSPKTVQRRLNRSLLLLMDKLGDLDPAGDAAAGSAPD